MRIFIFIVVALVTLKADLNSNRINDINNGNKRASSKLWQKKCNEGNSEGCFTLGFRYDYGVGVKK